MDVAVKHAPLKGAEHAEWTRFLAARGLRADDDTERVALAYEDERLVACGTLSGCVLKHIAVDEASEGGGACARVVSELVHEAYRMDRTHLFLCTKPQNGRMFASLGFYRLAETRDMLLMENQRDGLERFLASIEKKSGVRGAIVMNANPFTNGHRALVEYAARACDFVYVFVLSEESGFMSAADRIALVRKGVSHIDNVLVCASEAYLVSRATFPAYFIKDETRVNEARASLDIALFGQRIAPALGITKRFIGTEPFCSVTRAYNAQMKAELPRYGVEPVEIERVDEISASRVRAMMVEGDLDGVRAIAPEATYEWAKARVMREKRV